MFWNNFYNACVSKGIKPNPLAKELNIASGSMTSWKNGKIPNGETLLKLADYLNVSIDYLLGRTNDQNGYSNKIVNDGNTTINDNGIQANVVNNQTQQTQFDSTTIQVAEVFQNLNFMDKAKVISLLAELNQKGA